MMREILVGTRKSHLALIQTNEVIRQLKQAGITNPIKIKKFDTKGDQNLDVSLSKVGGKGIFSNEIEQALHNKEIDFAVHSMKDLPPIMPEGLTIAAIPRREDHRDAYISKNDVRLENLPAGATIGTSSIRRAAQILAIRPDLQTKSIRGPVESRIRQLEKDDYDAIILAVAGLKRLDLEKVITEYLPADTFIPAIGQGALAIQSRSGDDELREILATINDEESARAIETERAFIHLFDEDEQAPVGGYAFIQQDEISLHGMVLTSDGAQVLREVVKGSDPRKVAEKAVKRLNNRGAQEILRQVAKELAE